MFLCSADAVWSVCLKTKRHFSTPSPVCAGSVLSVNRYIKVRKIKLIFVSEIVPISRKSQVEDISRTAEGCSLVPSRLWLSTEFQGWDHREVTLRLCAYCFFSETFFSSVYCTVSYLKCVIWTENTMLTYRSLMIT